MSIIILNMNMPSGCQRCKFFKKLLFGNGLDYSYSCILGARDFPMPWIRQMDERASDCPIKPSEQEPCGDAVNRQAVLEALDSHKYSNEFCEEHHIDWSINLGMAHITINDLPPVAPKPETVTEFADRCRECGARYGKLLKQKTGHWIDDKCSVCEKGIEDLIVSPEWYRDEKPNFCPFCGLKIAEPQERSEG